MTTSQVTDSDCSKQAA